MTGIICKLDLEIKIFNINGKNHTETNGKNHTETNGKNNTWQKVYRNKFVALQGTNHIHIMCE